MQYVKPEIDRANLIPEKMPTNILSSKEIETLMEKVPEYVLTSQIVKPFTYNDLEKYRNSKKEFIKVLPFINEQSRRYLTLRDTDKISEAKAKYIRRK